MASFVQGKLSTAFAGSSVSVSLTGIVAGNDIRVALFCQPSTLVLGTVSDAGGTYTNVFSDSTDGIYLLYFPGHASGSATITANFTGTISNTKILAEEWSGDATSSALDGSSGSQTNPGSFPVVVTAGSGFTTAANGDDIWCVILQGQGVTPTVQSGFTIAYNNTDGAGVWSEHMTQTTAGSITPSWTVAAGSFSNQVMAAGFKPLAAGASKTPYNPWGLWMPVLGQ